ncbi:MAG: SDR family oxidoreductase [Chloroflexi bacterium]|nr:SDR family oxidoreductase [Chloroflexota bacterium]
MKNQVAVVTGSAHRVGKGIALGLAARGANIVAHYNRAAAEAAQTIAEIAALGVEALAAQADLSTPSGADRLFETTLARFGRIDALVNSAAVMEKLDILSLTADDWDRVINTNLRGPFLCSQRAARQMMKQEAGGTIVNIADVSGLQPWAKYPVHSVSKAGLIMLTQVMAKGLGPKVRVNAVAAGPVLRAPEWSEERFQAVAAHSALKRAGTPDDVARAVIFLLENDYITGETIVVDGGGRLF